jgi:Disulphide bond corrector protein DsbC
MGQSRFRKRFVTNCSTTTPKRVVVAIVALGLLAFFNPSVSADPPAPASKDSPRFVKSKNAEFTASVEPAEASPGMTVTFKVTAKLEPGYHVYKYSKSNKRGPGPVSTTFDFFDPAGLKIEGDWTASQEPEKHKDPNFTDLDSVEYHENEITWSIKLKVPDDTAPGRKALRCQAGYMVCDAKSCSIPGQWTLPDAVLTVLPPDGKRDPKLAKTPQPVEPRPGTGAATKKADQKPEVAIVDAPKTSVPNATP